MTKEGECVLPSEEENCILITITDEELDNCVKVVPKLETLVSSKLSY